MRGKIADIDGSFVNKIGVLALVAFIISSAILGPISIIGIAEAATITQIWSEPKPSPQSDEGLMYDEVFYETRDDNLVATHANQTELFNDSLTSGSVYLSGLAIDSKDGYGIASNVYGHVWEFDPKNGVTKTIQSDTAMSVSGMDIDPSNDIIYVSDTDTASVKAIDRSGNVLRTVASFSNNPDNLAYDSVNHRLGVLIRSANELRVYDLSDDSLVYTISLSGYEYVDSIEGEWYVSEGSANKISKFTSSGALAWNKSYTNTIAAVRADKESGLVAASEGGSDTVHLYWTNGTKEGSITQNNPAGVGLGGYGGSTQLMVSGSDATARYDTGVALSSKVSGHVEDKAGTAISGANVEIEDSGNNVVFSGNTDTNGNFSTELEDGSYTLNITKSGYYPHESTFNVSGSSVDLGTIQLEAIPKVEGVVINQSSSDGINNSTVKILDNGTIIDQTTTNQNGQFGFELDNGTYTINVSHLNYYPYESTINVSGDTDLGDIKLEPKEYNLVMRVSPYMNHSQSQKYVVRFNDDTITENVTVTSSNKTLITVNQTTLTLNSTSVVNDTGEVNITVTYKVDGLTLRDSKNVTVAPIDIEYVEILSPLYSTLAIATDKTIQFLALAIIAGVGIATVTNAFGGIGLMIITLIMGWIMDYIPLGVLLASLFGGIFIMLNTQLREYRVR